MSSGSPTWPSTSAIRAALDRRPTRVIVTLGGSATVDGGLGMLRCLGARLLDDEGRELDGWGGDLALVRQIDLSRVDARLPAIPLMAAADVTSPLHGTGGAARLFGPQKGADPDTVELLDGGLGRLGALLHVSPALAGAGAAGGMGAAFSALGATVVPGADLVMDATGFDAALRDADLCLTGEGRIDRGTLAGKTPARVAARCAAAGVACIVLGGAVALEDADEDDLLATGGLAIGPGPRSLDEALAGAEGALRRAARAACAIFRAGRDSTQARERNP